VRTGSATAWVFNPTFAFGATSSAGFGTARLRRAGWSAPCTAAGGSGSQTYREGGDRARRHGGSDGRSHAPRHASGPLLTAAARNRVRAQLLRDRERVFRTLARSGEEVAELLRRAGERDPCAYLGPDARREAEQLDASALRAGTGRELLEAIDAALRLLDSDPGAFAACVRCGGAIAPERFEVVPHTRFCSACATSA
jgi:RNA polymerase-binding transcription factor DksA